MKLKSSPLIRDREGRSHQSIITIIHTLHYQCIGFHGTNIAIKCSPSKSDRLELR